MGLKVTGAYDCQVAAVDLLPYEDLVMTCRGLFFIPIAMTGRTFCSAVGRLLGGKQFG